MAKFRAISMESICISSGEASSKKLTMDYKQINFELNKCQGGQSTSITPATSQSTISNYSGNTSPIPLNNKDGRRCSLTFDIANKDTRYCKQGFKNTKKV